MTVKMVIWFYLDGHNNPGFSGLNGIVAILGVSETSKERDLIFDYAAIDAGKIPQYVLEDAELVKRLPLFFRTAKGKKPTKEELITLAEILRTA